MPEVQTNTIEPLALSPKAIVSALSIMGRAVHLPIAYRKLTARKHGSRTLIDFASVKAHHATLPAKTASASIPNASRHNAIDRKAVR